MKLEDMPIVFSGQNHFCVILSALYPSCNDAHDVNHVQLFSHSMLYLTAASWWCFNMPTISVFFLILCECLHSRLLQQLLMNHLPFPMVFKGVSLHNVLSVNCMPLLQPSQISFVVTWLMFKLFYFTLI